MSNIAMQGGATGTGTVTLLAPSTSTNRTLTLPDATGTVLTSATTTGFPAGSVLQVVQGSYSSGASTSSTSYGDTGLTATITPTSASSKILVMVSHNGVSKNVGSVNNGVNIQLLRGATVVSIFGKLVAWDNQNNYNVGFYSGVDYLDSPATTSAVTYKTQFANYTASSSVEVNANGAISYITLMEIAA